MATISGAIGKADAFASYIIQLQSGENPSESSDKKRKLTVRSTTDCHVQFPVSLPTLDQSILTELLTILEQCDDHKLFLSWNYNKFSDAIIAVMKVFSECSGECILENECVIMSNQFKEESASKFEDNTQLFVAMAFAAHLSLLDVSHVKLCPSADKRSVDLRFNVKLDVNRAKSCKAEELVSAISRIIHLEKVFVKESSHKKARVVEPFSAFSHLITPPASLVATPSSSTAVSPPTEGYPVSSYVKFSALPIPIDTSLESFFANIQPPVSDRYLENYVCPKMAAKLTPFQTQNVEWMVCREGHLVTEMGNIIRDPQLNYSLPLLYSGSHSSETSGNYINLFTDITTTNRSKIEALVKVSYRGGILADEMGLGKTVSVLGLISKHTWNSRDSSHPKPKDFPAELVFSKGTIIVAPGSIMSQWASEAKKHAPHLKVYEYCGAAKDPISAEMLAKYDVVLVYYETFKSEIAHSQPPPDRPRRQAAKYEFKMSPLVSIFWFRCILDEAQMVESTTTRVSSMANKIPRWYSWAVTGTPMKSDFNDLFGLYNFLHLENTVSKKPSTFEEFHSDLKYKGLFFAFTKATMRRNMKSLLSTQIFIPPQSRHVVRIPFSTIEQHYYEDLWRSCRQKLRLDWVDSIGWELPVDASDSTRETFHQIKLKMRSYLLALRQNCIHPSVINNPALRLGNQSNILVYGNKKVQSLNEVLGDMAKEAKDAYDNSQYAYYIKRLKHGGMFELLRDWSNAIKIYSEAIPKVEALVKFHTEEIHTIQNSNKRITATSSGSNTAEEAAAEEERKSRVTNKIAVLTKWHTLLHQFYFYVAGVYHAQDSEDLEIFYYNKAADLRRTLLEKQYAKVEWSMLELNKAGSRIKPSVEYNVGPRVIELDMLKFKAYADEEMEDDEEFEEGDKRERDGDMNMLQNLKRIGVILDRQYEKILYLRQKTVDILAKKLIDSSDGQEDATGDEYDNSLSEQEMCQVYISAYQALLQDRKFIIKGTVASIADMLNSNDNGEFVSDKAREVERVEKNFRKSLKVPGFRIECFKDIEYFLRTLKTTMRTHESEPEYNILTTNHEWLKSKYFVQSKLLEDLDVDVKKLSQLFNSRIAYYKHLQQISDTLLDWKNSNPSAEIRLLEIAEEKFKEVISQNRSRDMYFKAMAEEQKNLERTGERIRKDCLICQEPLEKGMITYCGHTSCVDCGLQWFKNSRRCHTCNSAVKPNEWYNVSYKQMEMQDKDAGDGSCAGQSNSNDTGAGNSNEESNQGSLKLLIQRINTHNIREGQGAKLDSIIRHIKYIKASFNGKCVVFSQWSKVLDMLKTGLTTNDIQCITLSGGANKSSVTKFQEDPNINVILLHARSQSSGLTLVSAQTVFIVEPVFNESLEKQAINRIHRIGQTKQTSVFWYIVQDTIEERIQEIHNRKRDRKVLTNTTEIDDELALSKLSDGGGEYVNDDDLRRCFTSNENYIY